MLRAPHSPYEPKRSNYLLKVKQLYDDECKIEYGNGNIINIPIYKLKLIEDESEVVGEE